MQTESVNSVSSDIADDSIILNILPLDERTMINRYFAGRTENSCSDCEVMTAA